jgi:radical SAM superfamily enzyme YgiQ (UPF0313 family)
MKIGLLNLVNNAKNGAMNKDLAGGMGTFSAFGAGFFLKLLSFVKGKGVKLPILPFAYLMAILKDKGHTVKYIETDTVEDNYDLILIYGSIVDFQNEINFCKHLKWRYPKTIIGFFGSFPTVRPDLFKAADFVIVGEAESFFLYDFKDLRDLSKVVKVKKLLDMDDLPTPDWTGFPIKQYSYFPAIKEKPFVTLQSSRGCPFSCSYYCAYGMIQGQKYRVRSGAKLVEDIKILKKKYGIRGLQFRDPTFGIDKEQTISFAKGIIDNKIKIHFGIETRLDLLDIELLKLLFEAGLRSINVGIETTDVMVSKANKRKLIEKNHQELIINFCKKLGIKVSAFYIFGLKEDTKESIRKTIDYAIKLNTNVAQFAISCPYPGTKYFDDLKSQGMIIQDDFEKFNSVNLVFKHASLSEKDLMSLKEEAFKRYYFRMGYAMEFIKWRIREFFL